MIVAEVFKVYLYPDPLTGSGISPYPFEDGEDITSGILNVNIIQGTDLYQGPQQQIDTGQFTIVSRNPNLDPKINPNLKYNSRIKFYDERTGEFFRGYVTDVQVEYQRKDDPIITITGTDIFGAMQRVVIDQGLQDAIMALSDGPTWNGLTFTEFIDYMSDFTSKYLDLGQDYIGPPGYPTPYGFWFESTQSFGELSIENLGYAPAKYIPQVGETYLDVINKYAQTNLTSFSAKSTFGDPMSYNYINVSNFAKYDPSYWSPTSDPYLIYTDYDFSSVAADNKPYETILIDNGYNRVINQVDISNEYRFVDDGQLESTTESFTRTLDNSIDDYAISRASISTIYPDDPTVAIADWADGYSQSIFQVSAFPGQEIQQITFDNARYEDVQNESSYSNYALNQLIRIKHEINDTETIDRIYDIAGIAHNISPDKWEMGFTLKPSRADLVFINEGSLPTLQMNATTGDSNFNFTATLVDFDESTVDNVVWSLSSTYALYPEYPADSFFTMYPYVLSGNMFKNGIPRTGFTQTWNFDDDGILAPYSFDSDGTYQEPLDNRYGNYGTGIYTVYAFITLTNGFTFVLTEELTVGTPEVEADFGWTQNLTNNFGQVSFINTSVNNETGEVDSYAWDFGDGTTSALENPTHVYNPGPSDTEYEVSLTVFAYGEDEEKVYSTHTETVTLVQPTMTANFTSSASGSVVTFTNTSTNVGFEEPDAYLWDFGDGTTSTLKNPVKTYAGAATVPLTFSVTLTTRNIWEQTATVTKNVTIAALYNTGTLPVTEVRVAQAGLSGDSRTPMMSFLRCLRSDGTNLSLNTTTTRASGQTWWQYNGDYENPPLSGTGLTRNILLSPNEGGLQFRGGIPGSFSLNTTIPSTQQISTINMRFDDIFPANTGPNAGGFIFDRYYVSLNDSFGGTYPVGYWEFPDNIPNFLPRQNFGRDYAMTPIRPMPPTIPYFKYTFNNTTVSFTSVETADSYAWTFGDGTTSTLKNPVKTYATKGTYTVTLAVTNGGVVTRTTTEPVIVEGLFQYPVRYMKIVQKEHTGINAWDTPYISDIGPIFNKNQFVQTTPQASPSLQPINIAKSEGYSMQWYPGTVSPDQPGPTSPMNPLTSPNNTRPWQNSGGLRVKSLDGTFRTQWELLGDFGSAVSNIKEITGQFSRWSNYDGTPNPVCTGISYEVYITNYVGLPAGIAGATWTKVGEFNPTSMPLNANKFYTMTPA